MDTKVKPENTEEVGLVEQFWREYCQELQSSANNFGYRLQPEFAVGAKRPPHYDFIVQKLVEQLTAMSEELLALPDGRAQFAARLAAMQQQLAADYRAPLYRRVDEMVAKRRQREELERRQQEELERRRSKSLFRRLWRWK